MFCFSCLEIKLRQQDFVECVRKNMRLEAVKMAKTYFSKLGAEHMPRVRMLMALLAFPSDTKVSPYMVLTFVFFSQALFCIMCT